MTTSDEDLVKLCRGMTAAALEYNSVRRAIDETLNKAADAITRLLREKAEARNDGWKMGRDAAVTEMVVYEAELGYGPHGHKYIFDRISALLPPRNLTEQKPKQPGNKEN